MEPLVQKEIQSRSPIQITLREKTQSAIIFRQKDRSISYTTQTLTQSNKIFTTIIQTVKRIQDRALTEIRFTEKS